MKMTKKEIKELQKQLKKRDQDIENMILCPWSFSSGEHAYYLPATPENVSYVKKQEELNDFSQKEFNYYT
jgi:hypothetical protein